MTTEQLQKAIIAWLESQGYPVKDAGPIAIIRRAISANHYGFAMSFTSKPMKPAA